MSLMLILISCDKDDELRGRPDFAGKAQDIVILDEGPENGRQIASVDDCLIDMKTDGETNYWVTPLIAGQNTVVGSVTVEFEDEQIIVTYRTFPWWRITETHLHVTGEDEADGEFFPIYFPLNQANNPQVGRFDYSKDENGNTVVYEENLPHTMTGCYYIAAHAVVQGIGDKYGTVDLEAFAEVLPKTATIKVDDPGDNDESYFKVHVSNAGILDGNWQGWCVQTGKAIKPGKYYDTKVFSSYETLPGYSADFLMKLNWIINQKFTENGFTYGEVQLAIWSLLMHHAEFNFDALNATSPNPFITIGDYKEENINQILDWANKVVEFIPQCGGVIAVIFIDGSHQDLIIEYPVVCKDGKETAWGQGCLFNQRGNWAMYFKVCTPTNQDESVIPLGIMILLCPEVHLIDLRFAGQNAKWLSAGISSIRAGSEILYSLLNSPEGSIYAGEAE